MSREKPETAVVIQTSCGAVRGKKNIQDGLFEFFGIPYAEPPVGELRFCPTVPKKPWQGIVDATEFGCASAQLYDPQEAKLEDFGGTPSDGEKGWVGQEDSLTLNIWTPAADGAKRPVFIWIHGGGNYLESSRLQFYHGNKLAAKGDIVVVSMNYRLGIFGFMDVSVLSDDPRYRGSSQNGLRDQATAIDWIHANIEAFGGDPQNMTVSGESAGGVDTCWLIASGRLKGKVRRAVPMSGIVGPHGFSKDKVWSGRPPQYIQETARNVFQRLGFSTIEELLAASTADIFARLIPTVHFEDALFDLDSTFWPDLDPDFAPVEPLHAIRAGAADGMDIMVGYTNYEMGFWVSWDDQIDKRSPEWMVEHFGNFEPDMRAALPDAYRKFFPDEPEGKLGMHMLGDALFSMPSTWLAEEAAQAGANVWLYRFDWSADERRGAFHAADLPFFFDRPNSDVANDLLGAPRTETEAQERVDLANAMAGSLIAFVRNGTPQMEGGPDWPQFTPSSRKMMVFDQPVSMRLLTDPEGERRRFWTGMHYDTVMG